MKKIILIILICLLLPLNAFAVTYGKTGESTNFNGDVGVPTGKGYYINGVQITSDALSDVASIAMLDENEDITGAWTMSTGSLVGVDATEFGYLDGVTEDIQTALDTILANVVEDTSPELGGEMDAGAHSIGFTMQTIQADDGTTTIDWKAGNKVQFTHYAGDETFTFTAPSNPCNLLLKIIQDGTGGRDCTFPATVKWLGTEPTWSDGGASKTIIMSMFWDGTSYWSQGTPWES